MLAYYQEKRNQENTERHEEDGVVVGGSGHICSVLAESSRSQIPHTHVSLTLKHDLTDDHMIHVQYTYNTYTQ